MKNNIKAFRNFIVNKIIGINNTKKTVFLLTRLLGLTLRNLYYDEQLYYVEQEQGEITYRDLYYELNGISKYNSFENSGEKYLMNVVLPKYIKENAIIFDAGAYIGEYALNLIRPKFPKQKIFAFEPNSYSFSILQENTKDDNQIHCYQLGLSSLPTTKELYDYGGSGSSVHSTIYQEVFS
jgi:tRNA G37 N-methylase Trm5